MTIVKKSFKDTFTDEVNKVDDKKDGQRERERIKKAKCFVVTNIKR